MATGKTLRDMMTLVEKEKTEGTSKFEGVLLLRLCTSRRRLHLGL